MYYSNHDDDDDDDGNHQASASSQHEVRYYGTRERSAGEAREPAPGAPMLKQDIQRPTIDAPQNQGLGSPQQQGPPNTAPARPAPPEAGYSPTGAGETAKPKI